MKLQRTQRIPIPTSHCGAQNWIRHYHSPFTPSALPHESKLCDDHQTRPWQIVGNWFHWVGTISKLAIINCGSTKEERYIAHMHWFLKVEHRHKKGLVPITFHRRSFGQGNESWSVFIIGCISRYHQIQIALEDHYNMTFIMD